MSCRLLAPTVGNTCNTGTGSVLREALDVSRHRLMGSSPAASLDSCIHAYVCILGSRVRTFTLQSALRCSDGPYMVIAQKIDV